MYEALHAAGIPLRANGHYPTSADQVTPELANRIVALYVAGRSAKDVAAEVGLPVPAVSQIVEERGVKRSRSAAAALAGAHRRATVTQPPGQWPAELAAAVLERYAAGQSGETIAGDLGLGQSRVYALLRECTLSSGSGVLRTLSEASALREARRRRPGYVHCEPELVPAEVAAQVVDVCHV